MNTRDIFKERLQFYIMRSGKNKKQISEEMKIPYTTFTEWANGKKFPRADGIEAIANYFGILKSDLLEEKQTDNENICDIYSCRTATVFNKNGIAGAHKIVADPQKLQSMNELLDAVRDLPAEKIQMLIQLADSMKK